MQSYGGSARLSQQLIAKLWDVLPAQDGFFQQRRSSDVGKLLFMDGIYDFAAHALQPFSRDVVCSGRVPRPFPSSFNVADVAFLKETLFRAPFATAEEGEAYQHAVMRGAIGDYFWKKIIVLLGPPSSGKGLMVMLLKCALGHSLATTFNGNDLLHRQHSGESDRENAWIAKIAGSRLACSSEMKVGVGVSIDGNKIKSVAGGGDHIDARGAYGRSAEFVPKCLPIVFAQDIPAFNPPDTAVLGRIILVNPTYSFVNIPDKAKSQKAADPTLADKQNTPAMGDAFIGLIVETYNAWSDAGKGVYVFPPAMLAAAEELVAVVDVGALLGKTFVVTGLSTDVIALKELTEVLRAGGADSISANMMGRELTRLGLQRCTMKADMRGVREAARSGIRRKTEADYLPPQSVHEDDGFCSVFSCTHMYTCTSQAALDDSDCTFGQRVVREQCPQLPYETLHSLACAPPLTGSSHHCGMAQRVRFP